MIGALAAIPVRKHVSRVFAGPTPWLATDQRPAYHTAFLATTTASHTSTSLAYDCDSNGQNNSSQAARTDLLNGTVGCGRAARHAHTQRPRLEPAFGLHQLAVRGLVQDGVGGYVNSRRTIHPERWNALVLGNLLSKGGCMMIGRASQGSQFTGGHCRHILFLEWSFP
jgi:hypothetical protein